MSDDETGIKTKITRHRTDVAEKEPKKEKKHKRWSQYHLIINTNQRFGKHDEELQKYTDKLGDVIDDLLGPQNAKNIVKFKDRFKDTGKFNREFIADYYVDHAEERSRNNNTVHSHSFIRIGHYALIELDLDKIRDFVSKEMGLDNVYVKIKSLAGNKYADNALEYILKDSLPPGSKIEEMK
jgi:hypothetical protein